jgi:hypothetical protein
MREKLETLSLAQLKELAKGAGDQGNMRLMQKAATGGYPRKAGGR